MKSNITFVYPTDPMGSKIGGIDTFIKGFIKYAPGHFNIRVVGVTSSPKERPPRRWTRAACGSRTFDFYPVFYERDANTRTRVPLSLRFVMALMKSKPDLDGDVLLFNRIEPALCFPNGASRKIGFIHNDIQRQMANGSEYAWKHFPWVYDRLEGRIFHSLDHIFTVSQETLRFYERRYPAHADKMSFLPTWVDTDVFSANAGTRSQSRRSISMRAEIPGEDPWILFVGRFQAQKAPLRLIETLYQVRRFGIRAQLLLAGTGNLKEKMIRRAEELEVRTYVHFLGTRSQSELARFYQASDVLLLTSNFEGMPRSCLEALGSGLVVVSTDVGEVRRVIKNGVSGEVVEENSPQALADAVRKVLSEPKRYRSAKCLESIRQYTPEKVLEKVYERCEELTALNAR